MAVQSRTGGGGGPECSPELATAVQSYTGGGGSSEGGSAEGGSAVGGSAVGGSAVGGSARGAPAHSAAVQKTYLYLPRTQAQEAAVGRKVHADVVTKERLDYTGHNIAAMAVNEFGECILSSFNHNVLFDSTTQHAEARLIEQCFKTPSLHFTRAEAMQQFTCAKSNGRPTAPLQIEDKMKRLTVYTTLEPCQQCSGKMLLARVPLVVVVRARDARTPPRLRRHAHTLLPPPLPLPPSVPKGP